METKEKEKKDNKRREDCHHEQDNHETFNLFETLADAFRPVYSINYKRVNL